MPTSPTKLDELLTDNFKANYTWIETPGNYEIDDPDQTVINAYKGGHYQECTSGLSYTNQACYELEEGCYATYGFEYKPG